MLISLMDSSTIFDNPELLDSIFLCGVLSALACGWVGPPNGALSSPFDGRLSRALRLLKAEIRD